MKNLGLDSTFKRSLNFVFLFVFVAIVVWLLYKVYKASKIGSEVANDVVHQNAITNQIANKTGIAKDRLLYLDNIALQIAKALNVDKNAPFYAGMLNDDEDSVISYLNKLTSIEEAIVVSDFFREIHTKGKSLADEVQDNLSGSQQRQIRFINHLT